jgi:hypothetical protein
MQNRPNDSSDDAVMPHRESRTRSAPKTEKKNVQQRGAPEARDADAVEARRLAMRLESIAAELHHFATLDRELLDHERARRDWGRDVARAVGRAFTGAGTDLLHRVVEVVTWIEAVGRLVADRALTPTLSAKYVGQFRQRFPFASKATDDEILDALASATKLGRGAKKWERLAVLAKRVGYQIKLDDPRELKDGAENLKVTVSRAQRRGGAARRRSMARERSGKKS